jgi:hypothetical protein
LYLIFKYILLTKGKKYLPLPRKYSKIYTSLSLIYYPKILDKITLIKNIFINFLFSVPFTEIIIFVQSAKIVNNKWILKSLSNLTYRKNKRMQKNRIKNPNQMTYRTNLQEIIRSISELFWLTIYHWTSVYPRTYSNNIWSKSIKKTIEA